MSEEALEILRTRKNSGFIDLLSTVMTNNSKKIKGNVRYNILDDI